MYKLIIFFYWKICNPYIHGNTMSKFDRRVGTTEAESMNIT